MAKRGGAKQAKYHKNEGVDDDNEPFLRAVGKKIRNINKKITQISQLQHKDNLKPEQIDKVNRKPQLIQERERLEKDLEMFRQVYQDNKEHYRNNQLKELQNIAQAITVYLAFPQFEQHQKLTPLWDAINTINGQNLGSSATNLSNALKAIANDRKLLKSLNKYVSDNTQAPIKEEKIAEVVQSSSPKVEVHTDQVIVYHEETVNEKGQTEEIEVVQKIHDGVVEEITVEVSHDNAIEPAQDQSPPPTPTEVSNQKEEEKPLQQNKEQDERPRTKKNNRPYRNNRENRQNRDSNRDNNRNNKDYYERKGEGRRNYRQGTQRREYKPKYEEKRAVKEEIDSNSESQDERRNFKKEQIQKLQEQGFTVVGKPKPKPKQPYRKNYAK